MMKTLSITVPIAMLVGFTGTLLTLFGPNTLQAQYLKFAIMVALFLVIMVGCYWIVVAPGASNARRRESPSGREAEEGVLLLLVSREGLQEMSSSSPLFTRTPERVYPRSRTSALRLSTKLSSGE